MKTTFTQRIALVVILTIGTINHLVAQNNVGIGTTTPNAKAIL